jgi:hypothetical protein
MGNPWPPQRHASGAKYVDGEIYVLTDMGPQGKELLELTRLSDGKALAAVRYAAPACISGALKNDSPFLLEFLDGAADHSFVFKYHRTDESLSFLGTTPRGIVTSWFDWNPGWGMVDGDSVRVAVTPSNDPSVIYPGKNYQSEARARGDLLAWIDWGTYPSTMRTWTPGEGVEPLFQSDTYDIVHMALSDETIAWMGGYGDQTIDGGYSTPEVYWAASSAKPLAVQGGVDVTGLADGGAHMVVGGDYVSFSATTRGVVLIRRSTGKKWSIAAPSDHVFDVVAASPTELLVRELSGPPSHDFLNYRRFDYAHLDELSSPLP